VCVIRVIGHKNVYFLPCDAMLNTVYAVVVCLSVCLSDCVSLTLRYCMKTAKCRSEQIMPHESAETLVIWHQSSRRNSDRIIPYGATNAGGV